MSKRKKTKKEKIIADLHRKLHSQTPISDTTASRHVAPQQSVYTYKARPTTVTKTPVVLTTNLPHVKHDLLKTTMVTSAIIIAQLFLFYLLKSHIIMIPMVRY
jgi:hypothetical protein